MQILITPFGSKTSYLAALLSLSLAGCGSVSVSGDGAAAPDDRGIYAMLDDGDFMRLDGERSWEIRTWSQRSQLGNTTQLVVVDPALRLATGSPDDAVRLYRVAWVRSKISKDGDIMPTNGSRWNVPESEPFRVPADVRRVDGRDDAVRVVPETALSDGLYAIRFSAGATQIYARLGVN